MRTPVIQQLTKFIEVAKPLFLHTAWLDDDRILSASPTRERSVPMRYRATPPNARTLAKRKDSQSISDLEIVFQVHRTAQPGPMKSVRLTGLKYAKTPLMRRTKPLPQILKVAFIGHRLRTPYPMHGAGLITLALADRPKL